MTPKERAQRIYEDMFYKISPATNGNNIKACDKASIDCAIIAVNLLIGQKDADHQKYWQAVKNELKLLY